MEKTPEEDNAVLSDMFLNANLKCQNAEKNRFENENRVQNALSRQKSHLGFWKKELETAVDKMGNERQNLQRCLSSIERNHNHVSCLLDALKQCQELRRTKNGNKYGKQLGDSTDRALSDECTLLLSCCQSYVSLGRDVAEFLRELKSIEVDLTEDLEKKTVSVKTSFDCQSTTRRQRHFNVERSNQNVLPQIGSPTTTTETSTMSASKVLWEGEINQRLHRAEELISQSSKFRIMVKEKCAVNCAQIKCSWSEIASKIELDRLDSNAEKEKAIQFLSKVTRDLGSTRERMGGLRSEIEKQRRHLEAVVRRFGEFQIKPESEQIGDDPHLEMKKQCDSTRSILESLEISRSNCKEQENKLSAFEKELRRSIERTSRTVFLHQDEVKGQQRRVPAVAAASSSNTTC